MAHHSQTTSWRSIVATFPEALDVARARVESLDPWLGANVSISPVMRDVETGFFQWEVNVTGQNISTDERGYPLPVVNQPARPAE